MSQDSADEVWEVEAILAHKFDAKLGECVYYTKWHGFPSSENTWEPPSSFLSGGNLLHHYLSRVASAASTHVSPSQLEAMTCIVCTGLQDEHLTMLCDACSTAYHIYCLKPKLHAVPDGTWHCPPCSSASRTTGAIASLRTAAPPPSHGQTSPHVTASASEVPTAAVLATSAWVKDQQGFAIPTPQPRKRVKLQRAIVTSSSSPAAASGYATSPSSSHDHKSESESESISQRSRRSSVSANHSASRDLPTRAKGRKKSQPSPPTFPDQGAEPKRMPSTSHLSCAFVASQADEVSSSESEDTHSDEDDEADTSVEAVERRTTRVARRKAREQRRHLRRKHQGQKRRADDEAEAEEEAHDNDYDLDDPFVDDEEDTGESSPFVHLRVNQMSTVRMLRTVKGNTPPVSTTSMRESVASSGVPSFVAVVPLKRESTGRRATRSISSAATVLPSNVAGNDMEQGKEQEQAQEFHDEDTALLFLPTTQKTIKYRDELHQEIAAGMDSDDMAFVAGDDEISTSVSGMSSEVGSSQLVPPEPMTSRLGREKAQKAAALAEIRQRKAVSAAILPAQALSSSHTAAAVGATSKVQINIQSSDKENLLNTSTIHSVAKPAQQLHASTTSHVVNVARTPVSFSAVSRPKNREQMTPGALQALLADPVPPAASSSLSSSSAISLATTAASSFASLASFKAAPLRKPFIASAKAAGAHTHVGPLAATGLRAIAAPAPTTTASTVATHNSTSSSTILGPQSTRRPWVAPRVTGTGSTARQ